jgi:TolB-like protein
VTEPHVLPFSAYCGDEPSVFVSYAHRDQVHVFKDLPHFHDAGLRLWYDEGIRLGTPWRDEIAAAIDRASVVVFYASAASIGSVSCVQEINYALDREKPVLTVFLTNEPLSPGLKLALGAVQGIERFRLDYGDFRAKACAGITALFERPDAIANLDIAGQIIQEYREDTSGLWLAILPFASLSNNPDNVFFAEGLTEEVTTTLARMPDMHVVSRNTSRAFQERGLGARTAGRELGVNYVVEGGVQSSATRLRVTVSLVDCSNGHRLWSERLDRPLSDLFDLQDEIAASICAQLHPNLIIAEAKRVRIDNLSAWAQFQNGWARWNFEYSQEASDAAITAFEESLRIDPDYAPPRAALGIVYANRAAVGWSGNLMEELGKARLCVDAAMAQAPHLALSQYAAAVLCNAFGDRADGREFAQRAMELEPANASIMSLTGVLTAATGNLVEGTALCQRAISLSPHDPRLHMLLNNLWLTHLVGDNLDAVVDACQQSLRVKREGNGWAVAGMVLANIGRGENDLAVENAKRLGGFNLSRFVAVTLRLGTVDEEALPDRYRDRLARMRTLKLIDC